MQEQTQNDQTPKIIALVVLIILIVGFIFWKILSANAPQTAQAPSTTPTQTVSAPPDTANPNVKVATVAGAERELGSLDDDNANGNIPPSSESVFKTPKVLPPPPPPKPTPTPIGPIIDTGAKTPGPEKIIELPATHPVDIKVEGVVSGADGFAMVTEGEQTSFKRVGDDYTPDYRIMRLSENVVTVRHHFVTIEGKKLVPHWETEQWPIGDKVTILAPGPGMGGQAYHPTYTLGSSSLPAMSPSSGARPAR